MNIDALARELSVSQTPIREALARLESTGLVHRAALKGYRVAPLFTERELSDLMDARAVIEPENAYLACLRSSETLVRQLAESIDDLKSVASDRASTAFGQYREADERFHALIAEHSDNRFLQKAYESLGGHVHRFRLFGAVGVTDAESAALEHEQILAAIQARDPEAARQAMAQHIANAKQRTHVDREAIGD